MLGIRKEQRPPAVIAIVANETKGPDWDDLRIFLQVARSGNLSRAAAVLRVDHSTVSRRIAHLEYSLGSRLIERKKEGLTLTELGRDIIDKLEAMEHQVVAVRERVAGNAAGEAAPVRISTYEGISSLYLAERLMRMRERHPSIRLEIVTSLQSVNVSRREADVFISFYEPEGRGLEKVLGGTMGVRLFAARSYLERRGAPTSYEDLRHHDFVTYIHDHKPLDTVRWLDEVTLDRREVFNSTSMISQMAAAVGGMGLVFLPIFAARAEPRLVPVLADEVKVQRELWISTHQDLRYIPRVKAVISFLKALFQEEADYLNIPPHRA